MLGAGYPLESFRRTVGTGSESARKVSVYEFGTPDAAWLETEAMQLDANQHANKPVRLVAYAKSAVMKFAAMLF
jgi:hypothetical protein